MTIRGAGILPFTYYQRELYFLLAEEGGSFSHRWGDLGGHLNHREKPATGAAREGYEESRGAIGSRLMLWLRLLWPSETVDVRTYRSYLLRYRISSLREIPRLFSATRWTGSSYNEVNRLQWIKASEIYRAVMGYRAGSGSSVSTSSGKTLSGRCLGVIRRSSGYQSYAAGQAIRIANSTSADGRVPIVLLRNGRAFAVTQQGSASSDLRCVSRFALNPRYFTLWQQFKNRCLWFLFQQPEKASQEECEAIFHALRQESTVHRVYRYMNSFLWNASFAN